MVHQVPAHVRAAFEQPASDIAAIIFIRVWSPELDGDQRFAKDNADYSWDGHVWQKAGFNMVALPDEDDIPRSQITLPNVPIVREDGTETRVGRVLIQMREQARLDMYVLDTYSFDLSTDPYEAAPGTQPSYKALDLRLSGIQVTASQVTANLQGLDLRAEQWPRWRATKDMFPGLYV